MFTHARYDFRRNSSSHAGSPFFSDSRRTMSSLRPGGNVSASTSVSKPYLYSRVASCSMVSVDVDMLFMALPGGVGLASWGLRLAGRGLHVPQAPGPKPQAIWALHTENDVPQPHVALACGFWNTNP